MCECYWRPKMRSFLFIYTLNSIISLRDERVAQCSWYLFFLQSTNRSAHNSVTPIPSTPYALLASAAAFIHMVHTQARCKTFLYIKNF